MKKFGAIYIGSFEMSLKVYEVGGKKNYRVIDSLKVRIDLERDCIRNGRLSGQTISTICDRITDFMRVLQTYEVEDYQIYVSPAIRRADNGIFLCEQIRLRSHAAANELSNSEQKLLNFTALSEKPEYEEYARDGLVVVDVGGYSLQITLIDKGKMITTQQILIGSVQIQEQSRSFENAGANHEKHLKEIIAKELDAFMDLYGKDYKFKYLTVSGDSFADIPKRIEKKSQGSVVEREKFLSYAKKAYKNNFGGAISDMEDMPELDALAKSFILIYRSIAECFDTQYVWIPGVGISEGVMFAYAFDHKWLKPSHDFEKDILNAAGQIAERYGNDLAHDAAVNEAALEIFDATKKYHGLGKRQRLLLQVAILLHDCGRYLSLAHRAEYTYDIIEATEIIGLSHKERIIVASVAKYNREDFPSYAQVDYFTKDEYLAIAKLSAIIRLAASFDASNKRKIKKLSCTIKDGNLVISVQVSDDILVEKLEFEKRAQLFDAIFNLKPVLKVKRVIE